MARKRRSLSSLLIPPFLSGPDSNLAKDSTQRDQSSRSKSHSNNFGTWGPSGSAIELSQEDVFVPPDDLLDSDPFANLSAPSVTSPPQISSESSILSSPTSHPVQLPRSPLSSAIPRPSPTKRSLTLPVVPSPASPELRPMVRALTTDSMSMGPIHPVHVRRAYQKPAFKPRPSLPSLDTLARVNVYIPKKVRTGRVGARLPAEPWDNPGFFIMSSSSSVTSSSLDLSATPILADGSSPSAPPPTPTSVGSSDQHQNFFSDLDGNFLDLSDNEDEYQYGETLGEPVFSRPFNGSTVDPLEGMNIRLPYDEQEEFPLPPALAKRRSGDQTRCRSASNASSVSSTSSEQYDDQSNAIAPNPAGDDSIQATLMSPAPSFDTTVSSITSSFHSEIYALSYPTTPGKPFTLGGDSAVVYVRSPSSSVESEGDDSGLSSPSRETFPALVHLPLDVSADHGFAHPLHPQNCSDEEQALQDPQRGQQSRWEEGIPHSSIHSDDVYQDTGVYAFPSGQAGEGTIRGRKGNVDPGRAGFPDVERFDWMMRGVGRHQHSNIHTREWKNAMSPPPLSSKAPRLSSESESFGSGGPKGNIFSLTSSLSSSEDDEDDEDDIPLAEIHRRMERERQETLRPSGSERPAVEAALHARKSLGHERHQVLHLPATRRARAQTLLPNLTSRMAAYQAVRAEDLARKLERIQLVAGERQMETKHRPLGEEAEDGGRKCDKPLPMVPTELVNGSQTVDVDMGRTLRPMKSLRGSPSVSDHVRRI